MVYPGRGREIYLAAAALEASSRMSKQARLSDVPASGKAAGRILQRGRLLSLKPGPAFTSREEDRQLIGRSEINHTLQTTQQPPQLRSNTLQAIITSRKIIFKLIIIIIIIIVAQRIVIKVLMMVEMLGQHY